MLATASPALPLALPGEGKPLCLPRPLRRLSDALIAAGGRPILVGGAARDHLLLRAAKDWDVEVYGLSLHDLEVALGRVGEVHKVGRSFGVLKVVVAAGPERETIDVALPRRENKVGRGHRGFVVESDPHMDFAEAAARRDFTLNAMGFDLASGALLDPHGGVADLRRGRLRHVSPAFDEDPLRVLRACQFAGRFALDIDAETAERCRALRPMLDELATERLWEEWQKMLLGSPWPSVALAALVTTGAIDLFPELVALRGCPQEAEWHPEGDVWIHTLLVVDAAARLVREAALPESERRRVLLGALCHDLGKPATTCLEAGRWRSKNHEAGGEAPTRTFLARIGAPRDVVEDVVPLVREHLKPYQLYRERASLSDAALRRLSLRVPIPRLLWVARADFLGRTTAEALAGIDEASQWLLAEAERLRIKDAAPQPILQGRHLLARGARPGPALGASLQRAFDAQLEGAFHDLPGALAWLEHGDDMAPLSLSGRASVPGPQGALASEGDPAEPKRQDAAATRGEPAP